MLALLQILLSQYVGPKHLATLLQAEPGLRERLQAGRRQHVPHGGAARRRHLRREVIITVINSD